MAGSSGRPLHPLAEFALRGLGQVAQRAVRKAVESVAEDFGHAADVLAKRARNVQVRARCMCGCNACLSADEEKHHCADCGAREAPERARGKP